MMFSNRVPSDLAPNRLAQAIERLRAESRSIIDLTESNPTRAGFEYPSDLLTPLADPRALTYAPQPLGAFDARRAVSADYRRRGVIVEPDRIVLTSSTSEAYSMLFKVLCDPGDEVLVPRPSYPLFEHLTGLDAVIARAYDLDYHRSWTIDFDSVERVCSSRTRAILAVSPNNPTGSFVKADELEHMTRLCARTEAAIIVDEVFADYELTPGAITASARPLSRHDALAFSLGGLSKSIGLPQVKLGWIALAGPEVSVGGALARLELACDTYLSVSTPVQVAAPQLLERGAAIRWQIQARVFANYRHLVAQSAQAPACHVRAAEGGWYAVLQVPSFCSEEDMVLNLLTKESVLAHPGYFFDFPRESFLVVSLLVPEDIFIDGISRILRHFDCQVGQA